MRKAEEHVTYALAVEEPTLDQYSPDNYVRNRIEGTLFATGIDGDPSLEPYQGKTAFMNHDDAVCVGGYVYGEKGFACYHRTFPWSSPEAEAVRGAWESGLDRKTIASVLRRFYGKRCEYQFKNEGKPLEEE